jgi:O6-methylguanine-DNA--protein-cysteine methyltransferase
MGVPPRGIDNLAQAPDNQLNNSKPTLDSCSLRMARGERSEEAWLWYTMVYEAIQEIPHGRVTSYGHIAKLVGKRTYMYLLG